MAHLQSHCTAQAPVCASTAQSQKPKPWVNNPPLRGDGAMRGTAGTARTVGNGEIQCQIDSGMHATTCPWRRRVCDAGLRWTRVVARDQARRSRSRRDGRRGGGRPRVGRFCCTTVALLSLKINACDIQRLRAGNDGIFRYLPSVGPSLIALSQFAGARWVTRQELSGPH